MEEFDELVFEASQFRSEILKQIDQNFAQIQKDSKDLAAKKAITKNIKEFTGVKDVIFNIKPGYSNAAVIPIYNQVVSADLLNVFKNYEATDEIRSLNAANEPSTYIKKIYVIIGSNLISEFSPRELTAIVLHELGHCFTYTANLPRILLALFQKGIGVAGIVLRVPILWLFNLISLPAYLISALIVITIVRSLTFLEHKGEFKVDQFPAKYGYATEMVKVLYKIRNWEADREADQNWLQKVWGFIEGLFSPSSHPNSSSRIREINEEMTTRYKKMYPKLSNELSIILKDVKSS